MRWSGCMRLLCGTEPVSNQLANLMETTSLFAFILASLVVLLIPGPGVIYVVTRSLTQGLPAGLISVIGLSTGALIHVGAATAGLSAILLASATAFGTVKLLGALYLIYLGLRTILNRNPTSDFSLPKNDSLKRIFVDGIVVSVLNPKIAVFFLAFLPQFINPGQGTVTYQFMALGLLYTGLALCTDGAYAFFANGLRNMISHRIIQGPLPRLVSGAVFLGLGAGLALADRRT